MPLFRLIFLVVIATAVLQATGCRRAPTEIPDGVPSAPQPPINPLEGLADAETIIAEIESRVPQVVPPSAVNGDANGAKSPGQGVRVHDVNDLLDRVQFAIHAGDLPDARRKAEEAVTAIDPEASASEKTRLYQRAANLLFVIGGNDRALEWAKTGAEIAGEITSPTERLATLLRFADLFTRLGNPDEALRVVASVDAVLNGSEAEHLLVPGELRRGRDRAIVDVIDLLLKLNRTEDARTWAREISDGPLREKANGMTGE